MTKEQAMMIAEAISQYDGWYVKVVEKEPGKWEPVGLHESGARFDLDDFARHTHEGLELFLQKEVQWMIDSADFMRRHNIQF